MIPHGPTMDPNSIWIIKVTPGWDLCSGLFFCLAETVHHIIIPSLTFNLTGFFHIPKQWTIYPNLYSSLPVSVRCNWLWTLQVEVQQGPPHQPHLYCKTPSSPTSPTWPTKAGGHLGWKFQPGACHYLSLQHRTMTSSKRNCQGQIVVGHMTGTQNQWSTTSRVKS